MFRYLAFAWDPASIHQASVVRRLVGAFCERHSDWREAHGPAGLCMLHRGAQAGAFDVQRLAGDTVLVAGTVFERQAEIDDDSPARRLTATPEQARAIATSRGRWLVQNCWGNYVAFGRDARANDTWALKDPTGELPCLVTRHAGVAVFFSCITDLLETSLFRFTLRPTYLAARVLLAGAGGPDALEQVETVGRGECVTVRDSADSSVPRESYWHPASFAGWADAIEDPSRAMRAMRSTVRSCTRSWAQLHGRVVHRLSGGLDSSIIAACLNDMPARPKICCYTYYSPRGRSDERRWARLVAQQIECEHIELPVRPEDIRLDEALDIPPSVEPTAIMGYIHRSTFEQQIVAAHQATAVFNGDGGDSGFGGEALAYALPEYLRRHGPGGRAFLLAAQTAAFTAETSWKVLYRAVRSTLFGETMEPLRRLLRIGSQLTSPQLRELYPVPSHYPHPWFSRLDRVPWGTIRRLGMLLAAPQFDAVAPGVPAPPVIAPLHSQPAVELFLRIPLYTLFDGRERGLARRAFAADVPERILQRQWKDRAPGFGDELVERNRALLRELLLDGVLMREGLLDRAAVERTLSSDPVNDPVVPAEILRHLDVEIWARSWQRALQPVKTSCPA
jgi:asparagine synthase (glutamine-hydrolysing)